MVQLIKTINNLTDLQVFARSLAPCLRNGASIFLQGELGAGKTTLVREILRGLGYSDKVKSPTYTLVEPYQIGAEVVFHFDFYRLQENAELFNIGISDYFVEPNICLVEWPDKFISVLPLADITINFKVVEEKRMLILQAQTARGEEIIKLMTK
jgi:tRNA threonylcarbamoyladenosine biosynthesis protein TsaE